MKIIDAFWEKRNLGLVCFEIHIEKNDSLDYVAQQYDLLDEKEYMVIRIPSTRFDIMNFFQQRGYFFIESALTLIHNLKQIRLPNSLKIICSKCSWDFMDESDIIQMKNEIDKNLFKTDRISIDPAFTAEQSARRYKGWIDDLIHSGTIPYKVMYKNDVIGFVINKQLSPTIYDGVLAAVYKDYEGSGMGLCIQYAGLYTAIERGGEKYIGHISASNIQVMKMLGLLGFEVTDIEYILVKHNN